MELAVSVVFSYRSAQRRHLRDTLFRSEHYPHKNGNFCGVQVFRTSRFPLNSTISKTLRSGPHWPHLLSVPCERDRSKCACMCVFCVSVFSPTRAPISPRFQVVSSELMDDNDEFDATADAFFPVLRFCPVHTRIVESDVSYACSARSWHTNTHTTSDGIHRI